MRLDHIAYRVADRKKTAQFFIDAFEYKIQDEFTIKFKDGTTAKCIALEPSEKTNTNMPWTHLMHNDEPVAYKYGESIFLDKREDVEYHLAPEVFVSDGGPGSIVGAWVDKRDGVGGVHHMAFQVKSVADKMQEWQEKGYAEFSTEEPLTCPGLTQVFTKPSVLTGVIYEFIERSKQGFCKDNVEQLMESTKGN